MEIHIHPWKVSLSGDEKVMGTGKDCCKRKIKKRKKKKI